jgi:hypothetical protein
MNRTRSLALSAAAVLGAMILGVMALGGMVLGGMAAGAAAGVAASSLTANRHLDWQPITAVATLALAVATFWMARRTADLAQTTTAEREIAMRSLQLAQEQIAVGQRQVDAAHEQVEKSEEHIKLSRMATQATSRPMLGDIPMGMYYHPEHPKSVRFDDGTYIQLDDRGSSIAPQESEGFAYCSIALRNIGTGAALITAFGLVFPNCSWSGRASQSIIPPTETTRLSFTIPKDREELQEGVEQLRQGRITLDVTYTDVDGGQPLITRCYLHRSLGILFRITEISFRHPDEEPFASSGPAG